MAQTARVWSCEFPSPIFFDENLFKWACMMHNKFMLEKNTIFGINKFGQLIVLCVKMLFRFQWVTNLVLTLFWNFYNHRFT